MAYIIKRLTDGDTTIDLGRRGENRATVIDFPLGFFIDNYGEGTPSLVHLRPGDTEPYVCYTVSTGDGYLRWYITDTDTAKAGSGKCELRWNVDDTGDGDTEDAYDTRAKSIIYNTVIHPSLTDETVIPDPYKDWYDAMMEGLTPVLEVESNPVFNLLDRGSEPRKSVIYAGDKLNQDKYVVPGAWWSPGWDTGHPIEDLPAVPEGSQFRFTVTGLYESTYTSDPPNYLIRKIEAEVVYGGASTSRELNVWAQIVDTRHQTSADRMIFHEWYRIPTGGDLNNLTTAVTANTAGLSNKLDLYTGTKIESNTDLNTLTTPGTYFCVNSATAATLVNSPLSSVGFRLDVSRNGYNTDNYLVQTMQAVVTSTVVAYKRGMSIQGTWGAWERINAGETEYTSLACSYGTLTYKCYKTGRIVSLIATIAVTSDIPTSSDFITGLPYTGQTSNYTPIRAFNDTTKTYIDLDLHRVSTSSCAMLSRTAIASGASIRINATYVTE